MLLVCFLLGVLWILDFSGFEDFNNELTYLVVCSTFGFWVPLACPDKVFPAKIQVVLD